MPTFARTIRSTPARFLPLIKSPQTALLLATGIAGYATRACPVTHLGQLSGLAGSLFLAICGSTILNMWHDRDIDARMDRTCGRPLPSGRVAPNEAFAIGLFLSIVGLVWAFRLSPLYAGVVLAGLFLDVVVYTLWLKRRTAWSIVWGGLSGGMPILAGRVLAGGGIDAVGILLAAAVVFWIPTHMMTFAMRYMRDYAAAGIPTFPAAYGFAATRKTIALSSLGAVLAIGLSAWLVGVTGGYMHLLAALSGVLFILAVRSLISPSEKLNFGLFKYASVYMLSSMLIFVLSAL